MNDVFVLGLDGIPWSLIRKWTALGELDNFQRFFEDGAVGRLASTSPPITPLAWPSLFCGVSPDSHGVCTLREISSNYKADLRTATQIESPTLWDILSPSVVANVPMTYPTSEIEGVMVSGMMTPDTQSEFTYPPELAEDITSKIPDYQIGLSYAEYYDRKDEFLTDLEAVTDARRELMRLLLEKRDWRLFFFVYTAPDRLQHLIWDEAIILDHYKKLDGIIGEALEYTEEHGSHLFVVSDHGFGPIEELVHVNALLRREGYLTPKPVQGVQKILAQIGLTKPHLLGLLERTSLKDPILDKLPETIVDKTAKRIPGDRVEYDLDYSNTRAFMRGFGNLYINDTNRFDEGAVEPDERDQIKKELETLLTELTPDRRGEQVLSVVDGDELFPSRQFAPDLVVEAENDYYVEPSLTETVFSTPDYKEGGHRRDGIFLAIGPTIESGVRTRNATVVDVVPTILHGVSEPVPENVDGRVLEEVFAPGTNPGERPVRTKVYTSETVSNSTDDNLNGVKKRLRGLGYIE